MKWSILMLACVGLCVETQVQARRGVKVYLQLVSFSNPNNRDLNNQCCDPACTRCDYYFDICLKETTGGRCVLSATTKTWDNTNDIVFVKGVGKLGNSNNNPLVKELSSWKGRLKASIDVKDSDSLSGADLVDKYSIDVAVTPTAGVLQQSWTQVTIKGVPSSMVIRYSVQCNRDYYGPRCTTYCMTRDDSQGHYKCDLQTGSKVCRAGWYGSDCLTYCMSQDNDVNGHYTCNPNNGNKVCLPGWYGRNCNTFCMARNDSQAGYTCGTNGGKICLNNWYPSNRCDVYCEPRNDSSAGYACDRTTGRKTCWSGWNGPDCDCKPRNDSTAGFYCNTTTGRKICLNGWYSTHCNKYCIPRNDSISHYSCNPKTGAKECLPSWFEKNCDVYCPPKNETTARTKCSVNNTLICARNWFGANCSVFCEPRDDDEVHYTCNQETGQKICLPGWYGGNCSNHCVPRDNDWFGHFDCDSDGNKRCHRFWYGMDCRTYCQPQNNSEGHFRCRESDGKRMCLENWFGAKCLTFCQERNDNSGHYKCNNVDGSIVCLGNWYGDNCTVHCAPRDDSKGHFTCDDTTGQKICMEGWTGQGCKEKVPRIPETTATPTASQSPPRNEESKKTESDVKLSELALALILGGSLLLICMTVAITIILCSRRQTKRPAQPFPYLRYKTSGKDSLEPKEDTPNEDQGYTESDMNPQAEQQRRGPNLLSQYDDEKCRQKDLFINLQEISWNEDGSRKVDEKLVMYNNPLFTERNSITPDVTRTDPQIDPRVDPVTGLRDNSDWHLSVPREQETLVPKACVPPWQHRAINGIDYPVTSEAQAKKAAGDSGDEIEKEEEKKCSRE